MISDTHSQASILIVDDDDPLVSPLPLLLDNDGALDIFPVLTPGNLLVAHSLGCVVAAQAAARHPYAAVVLLVPVGVIASAWGGSNVESWIDADTLPPLQRAWDLLRHLTLPAVVLGAASAAANPSGFSTKRSRPDSARAR